MRRHRCINIAAGPQCCRLRRAGVSSTRARHPSPTPSLRQASRQAAEAHHAAVAQELGQAEVPGQGQHASHDDRRRRGAKLQPSGKGGRGVTVSRKFPLRLPGAGRASKQAKTHGHGTAAQPAGLHACCFASGRQPGGRCRCRSSSSRAAARIAAGHKTHQRDVAAVAGAGSAAGLGLLLLAAAAGGGGGGRRLLALVLQPRVPRDGCELGLAGAGRAASTGIFSISRAWRPISIPPCQNSLPPSLPEPTCPDGHMDPPPQDSSQPHNTHTHTHTHSQLQPREHHLPPSPLPLPAPPAEPRRAGAPQAWPQAGLQPRRQVAGLARALAQGPAWLQPRRQAAEPQVRARTRAWLQPQRQAPELPLAVVLAPARAKGQAAQPQPQQQPQPQLALPPPRRRSRQTDQPWEPPAAPNRAQSERKTPQQRSLLS